MWMGRSSDEISALPERKKRWKSSHYFLFSGNLEIGAFLEKIPKKYV